MQNIWTLADEIDIYSAGWTFDHFYPLQPENQDGPCFEGWTTLAVLAGLTRRLRLGVMVSGNPFRHPAVLANMAATLDIASGGRVELGLGAGWYQVETDAYGLDLPPARERLDRLAEACEVIDSLLTNPTTTFVGRHYRLREARCEPKSIQAPRPPLVIGGGGELRTLRIAARWADQWNLASGPPDVFRRKLDILHEHCRAVGRDPSSIEPSVQIPAEDPGAAVDAVATFAELGAEHAILVWRAPFDARGLESVADKLRDSRIT
jgi:F420-dependent oxidoreductase-like protein